MSFLTPSLRWCMESQWVGSILKQCEQHDCEWDGFFTSDGNLHCNESKWLQSAPAKVCKLGMSQCSLRL